MATDIFESFSNNADIWKGPSSNRITATLGRFALPKQGDCGVEQSPPGTA